MPQEMVPKYNDFEECLNYFCQNMNFLPQPNCGIFGRAIMTFSDYKIPSSHTASPLKYSIVDVLQYRSSHLFQKVVKLEDSVLTNHFWLHRIHLENKLRYRASN